MRPRIFSLMLTAFTLVIVLGVGGMLLLFWLTGQNDQRARTEWGVRSEVLTRAEARRLARLYERNGAWTGVDIRLRALERELRPANLESVALLDAQGRVVTLRPSAWGEPPPVQPSLTGIVLPGDIPLPISRNDGLTVRSVPIMLRGDQVGALVLVYRGAPGDQQGAGTLARSILGAGVGLAAILIALAAFFSSRISTPLRQLDAAARSMAAGNLRVRVQPGLVREVADLARSFNQMADALEDSDRQRRQLTADVAHELRTPLSIIKGRLEGIQDGVYRAETEQIDGLLDKVALLERLIEDLRLLALADAGQLALHTEPVNPARLLEDARASFAQQAGERNIELRVEAETAPELTADPQRISQVLGNLVNNALRHTPPGGVVTLAVRSGPSEALFEVRDTGNGIAPEDLPRIFDRFYRADPSRSRASGGAGLGLAIARRIVEAHGGRIWAESAPGQGATVRFTLPW
ncbi:MAG: ATP-binding protein [Oscillochloridaceae bacterium]|nr:ATP-binding protein [Chloroflexaceae bacterium]MDW8390153.1 ATP-binding protein [Oscillochloridaceae bacterium]